MQLYPANSRLTIIGNSGSGKTTLARALGGSFGLPVHHLDPIRWKRQGIKRNDEDAKSMVSRLAEGDAWIVEGVFGWLTEAALPRATALVWLDLSWHECRDGLHDRGSAQEGSTTAFDELIAWAGDYWSRASSSSFMGHGLIYEGFPRAKLRIRSRSELDAFRERQLVTVG